MMDLKKIDKKELLTRIKPDVNGNFSLTDLWKLTNGENQKAPAKWQESEPVQRFISTASKILNIGISDIIKSKRGKGGGTFGHKQIFLEYAQYLDPELAVVVNEVFFQRIEEDKNPELAIDRAIKKYEEKGKDPQWIAKRLHSKGIRNVFTNTLKKHGVINVGYKDCTNAIYMGLFGKPANDIRELRKLPKDCNVRENLSSLELSAVSLAEELAIEDISKNRLWGNEECSISSNRASRSVSQSIIQFRNNK